MGDPVAHTDTKSAFGGIGTFVKAHPYESAGIALGVVLVVWYLVASGGSSNTSASTGGAATNTTDAAAVLAAQIAANQAIALGTIGANVTDNQTAAAQAVGLAQIQAQTDQVAIAGSTQLGSVYYNTLAEVTASNAATAIAGINANAAVGIGNDQVISNEFASLAGLLASFGQSAQQVASGYIAGIAADNIAAGSTVASIDEAYLQAQALAAGGSGGGGTIVMPNPSVGAYPPVHTAITSPLPALLQGQQSQFASLAKLFGTGLAPPPVSFAAIASGNAANLAAVSSPFTNGGQG